jgi:hypothetical protein
VLAHAGNSGETTLGLIGVFVLGLLFCALVYRTGSVWFPIGFHAGWDFAESFLYSVPNSGLYVSGHLLTARLDGPAWLTGGTAGPEGSVVCIALAAAAAAVIYARAQRSGAAAQSGRLP